MAYATSNRGACHVRGYTIASEALGIPVKTELSETKGKPELVKAYMKHVILGNGPAGVIAAKIIRKRASQDQIVMIGSEAPYSRMAIPYLLMGNISESGTYLRKEPNHFETLKIEQIHGKALAVNAKAKNSELGDGQLVQFDKLLIATGSIPVQPPIPGIDLPGVHLCWTLEDSRAITKLAKPGSRVLQMGDRMVPRMMTSVAGGMIKNELRKRVCKCIPTLKWMLLLNLNLDYWLPYQMDNL